MPKKLNIDDEGFLLNEAGERVEMDGEPVQVGNAKTQKQVDAAIKERLARQDDKVKALEEAAKKSPELEKLLQEAKDEKRQLEEQLSTVKKTAEEEVATQLNTFKTKAEKLDAELKAEREARLKDQVATQILGKADKFINPARDIVPELLSVHKREPKVGTDNKPIPGEFVDTFKVSFKNEKGEEVSDYLPLDKALETIAGNQSYAHYMRSNANSGSGGGNYQNISNLKRSAMNDEQKAAFVGQHGVEAFQGLPQ